MKKLPNFFGKKKNKYMAKRIAIDGIKFDSLKEGRRYQDFLKPRLLSGEIEDIVFHPRFTIDINGIKVCDVLLDFQYFDIKRQQTIYEDVKSKATALPLSKLKKKMAEAYYGIEIDWV